MPSLPPLGLPVVSGLTVADRAERGRAARKRCPRRSVADWAPAPDRLDPISLLEAQNTTRTPELLPLRHQRMSASAFAFYRGAALVMASDLGGARPHSGLVVQLCGDAHLANFGGFASPERELVYDLNDFDETHTLDPSSGTCSGSWPAWCSPPAIGASLPTRRRPWPAARPRRTAARCRSSPG